MAVGPHARPLHRHLAAAQHDLAGHAARARGRTIRLMRIPHATEADAVLFHHGFEHFHAGPDGQLQQFAARIHQEIDEREVTQSRDGFDLARRDDCARLSLHGGSF